jgi:hypothetical protein
LRNQEYVVVAGPRAAVTTMVEPYRSQLVGQ